MDTTEWTAKDDLTLLFQTFQSKDELQPPKVDHHKIITIQQIVHQKRPPKKNHIPREFSSTYLNKEQWELFLEDYECMLEHILTLEDPIPELVRLEKRYFSYYPFPPKVSSPERLREWTNKQVSYIKRYYSDLLPPPYRLAVSTILKEEISDEQVQTYTTEIEKLSKKTITFQEIRLVKLPTSNAPKKLVKLK